MDQNVPILSGGQDLRPSERRVEGARRPGLVLGVALAWCRIQSLAFHAVETSHAFITRLLGSGQRLSGGVFSESLSLEEKSRLTISVYDFYPGYKVVGDTLYRWEEVWFEHRMPRPPARILVGACGTGREAIALAERGYSVVAFEPAPEFVAESQRRLGGRAPVMRWSYEQLNAIVLDGAAALGDEALRPASYDAVLLGCGSLTHVLDAREHRRLLLALDILCPEGPILASFFCEETAPARHAGRAIALGRRIGRGIARLRGLPPAGSDRLSYRAHSGFAYTFTESEIEDLAQTVERQVAWERGEMRPSHFATFLPRSARA
jgi:SAM-dependent methyltransferase